MDVYSIEESAYFKLMHVSFINAILVDLVGYPVEINVMSTHI